MECEVAFLPYAPLESGLKIGGYEIWPYYESATTKISDKKIISRLNKNFGRYFERCYDRGRRKGYDKRLEKIFIITPENFPVNPKFSENQKEDICFVGPILAFSAITEQSFKSSDAFILYLQGFKSGSGGISLGGTSYSRLSMVKFMKPHFIHNSSTFNSTNLCQALGQALSHRDGIEIRKVFRALEFFYHSTKNYYNEVTTLEHKLLELVRCFEILVGLNGKKCLQFAEKIHAEFNCGHCTIETRLIKESEKEVEFCTTAWWAYDLYDLRNKIIHCSSKLDWQLAKYGDINTRIRFGGIILKRLIKRILAEKDLWHPTQVDRILEASCLDEELQYLIQQFNGRHQ